MLDILTELLVYVAVLGLIFGLFSTVERWVEKERANIDDRKHYALHRHPKRLAYFFLVAAALFAALSTYVILFEGFDYSEWLASIGLYGFSALLVIVAIQITFTEYRSSQVGVEFFGLLTRRSFMNWNEVSRLSVGHVRREFRFRTHSSQTYRFSYAVSALPEFASLVLDKVPKQRIDKPALEILEKSVEGQVPKALDDSLTFVDTNKFKIPRDHRQTKAPVDPGP